MNQSVSVTPIDDSDHYCLDAGNVDESMSDRLIPLSYHIHSDCQLRTASNSRSGSASLVSLSRLGPICQIVKSS